MGKLYDVIIAGAGPCSLFLAGELGLFRGASVLVLEREPQPQSPWKTSPLGFRALNTVSIETFYRRGLLSKVADRDGVTPWAPQKGGPFLPGGHFAGLMFDANRLDLDRHRYRLPGPALFASPTTMERTETALAERAKSLGVEIIRGSGVTDIVAQDDKTVTVRTSGDGKTYQGRWLVGCDGGHSAVRHAARFEFKGTEPRFTGYSLKCDLDHPEKLPMGFHVTDNGMVATLMQSSLYLLDFDGGAYDRAVEPSVEHVQAVLNKIMGNDDVKITKLHLVSTFTDRTMQATSYRKGRVLLAGDAAHIHAPIGGQGLNMGVGDVVNLGWKLAATVRQEQQQSDGREVDLSLLDTYDAERRPFGARVLEWTRAQIMTLTPGPHGAALRQVMRDVMATGDGANFFIERAWGLSESYRLGGDDLHPAVGQSAPDFELADGSRLGPKLVEGRALLVDFGADSEVEELAGKYEGRVKYISTSAKDACGIGAVLVRPDGVVAWAVDEGKSDVEGLETAMQRWLAF